MAQLPAPTNVRLCDAAAREATRLCIAFDLVPLATEYDLRINGATLITNFVTGTFITGLKPNIDYLIEVRARAAGFQDSDFSVPILTVTRPPVPSAPSRLPIDLQGWGVTLVWNEPGGWNGASGATTQLLRDDSTGSRVIFESLGLTGRFVDTRYPLTGLKAYRLRISVTSATLGGPNVSIESASTDVKGPISSVAPTGVNSPLIKSLQTIHRARARLLGITR